MVARIEIDVDSDDASAELDALAEGFDEVADMADDAGDSVEDFEDSAKKGGKTTKDLTKSLASMGAKLGAAAVALAAAGVAAKVTFDVFIQLSQEALDYSDALAGLSSNLDITTQLADIYADRLVEISKFQLDNVRAAQLLNKMK